MGQGVANIATGLIGGMAGCAMIGQSVINVKSGGRGRLSTLIAGVVLLILVLARGVLTGVLLSGFFFAHKIGQILLIQTKTEDEGTTRIYEIYGQVFFASAERLIDAFDFDVPQSKVRIDLTHAHFGDITAVSALDKVVMKYRRKGAEVEVIGLNEASTTLVDKFGVHDKNLANSILMGH